MPGGLSFSVRGSEQFIADLEASKADVAASLAVVQRAMALEVLVGVVQGTPVDTGRARGAWVIGHNAPVAGDPNTPDLSGQSTISRGIAESTAIQPFERTFVSNDVPYIVPLEEGHSRQSRAFVAATVARVNAQFQTVRQAELIPPTK